MITPQKGAIVRVVIEGEVTFLGRRGLIEVAHATSIDPGDEHVKSLEVLTPPERCQAQPPKGENSWWMNDDQWEIDLCRCTLSRGHDGKHNCEHNTPWTGEWKGVR